jgi:hypothetical protein
MREPRSVSQVRKFDIPKASLRRKNSLDAVTHWLGLQLYVLQDILNRLDG